MSKPRLLMICCSKGRTHRIQDMVDSYRQTYTKGHTDILYCLNPTDNQIPRYLEMLEGEHIIYRDPNYYTKVANEVCLELKPKYDYYGLVDDDYVFRTKGWDAELCHTVDEKGKGWGIAYCNDLWPDSSVLFRHPSCPVVSGKMARLLGYMILPTLNHFKIDTFMRDLTEPLGLLFFREDVIAEHMHLHNGKAKDDDSYRWSYCPEEWRHGETQHRVWLNTQAEADRQKIVNAMANEVNEATERGGV